MQGISEQALAHPHQLAQWSGMVGGHRAAIEGTLIATIVDFLRLSINGPDILIEATPRCLHLTKHGEWASIQD